MSVVQCGNPQANTRFSTFCLRVFLFTLTLGEIDDMATNPTTMLLNNAHWNMPVTENPTLNSVEIWSLMNFTDDSHPIHLHLVRFQILDRRSFEPYNYYTEGKVKFIGPAVPPDPGEAGWKDTVQAHPGMITRIIARFEGYPGRYGWHCHILEHENNEMMRPFEVSAGTAVAQGPVNFCK